ncbi:MAG: potassium transporter TrkG, partial [Candidatus Flemingiibacterium sp.]
MTPKQDKFSSGRRLIVQKRLKLKGSIRLTATQIIIIGFLLLILLGGLLLMLPVSSASGSFTSPEDAMFTAVSATCVTGLTVVPSGTYWSMFGQIVILILIQIGGLGFMTLAVMLSIFARRQITPRERVIVAQSLGLSDLGGTINLVKRILLGTFSMELVGAVILATQFIPELGWGQGIWCGIFHS